ncbi:MAG: hypothetical protein AAF798_01865 [Bacteroidota bacterium]
MSFLKSTRYSKIYREFQAIDALAFQQIVRFYEEKERKIEQLPFEEYFELLVTYVNALFEIGAYNKHLTVVDLVIEASVINNIQYYKGEDVFYKMLFRKAASLFHIHKYEETNYILRELLKMNPQDKSAALFLKKCLRKRNTKLIQSGRAIAIFLLLLTAFVIAFEVLFVRPFYELYTPLIERLRTLIFISGPLVLALCFAIHRWLADRKVQQFIQQIIRSKQTTR